MSGSGYSFNGDKNILLENSQLGVNYTIMEQGNPRNQYAGTGGPIQMSVYNPGFFSMGASFSNCFNSFRAFGDFEARDYPEAAIVTSLSQNNAALFWPGIRS